MTTPPVRDSLGFGHHNVGSDSFAGLFVRKQISSDPAVSILDVEHNELLRAWKRFQDYIPANDRVNFQQRLQLPNDVLIVIHNAQEVWRNAQPSSIIRNLLSLSERVAATIESHSAILRLLPDYKLYGSALYGVIQSLIKASIHHRRVAAGLLQSLLEINEAIPPSRDVWHQVPALFGQRVSNLYSRIFLFLGQFMDTYINKGTCRLLDSHNEDFYVEFEDLIRSVKASAQAALCEIRNSHASEDAEFGGRRKHVRRTSSDLLHESRLRQAGLEGIRRRNAAQTTITRQLICDIQRHTAGRARMKTQREVILTRFRTMLTSQLFYHDGDGLQTSDPMETWIDEAFKGVKKEREKKRQPGPDSPPPRQGPMHRLTKSSLQCASRGLQDWFSNDQQHHDFESDMRLPVDSPVARELCAWMSSLRSEAISVSREPVVASPSDTKLIAACCLTVARRQNIPAVAHFVSQPCSPREGLTRAQQGLIALGYSLIRQLIEIGPPVLDCDSSCDLSSDRFGRFDGTMSSWSEVVSVLDSLLYFAPPILLVVIDGLAAVDDASTRKDIQLLLDVLVSHTLRLAGSASNQNMSPQSLLMKVLFTDGDRSESIATTLEERQMVLAKSIRLVHVPQDRAVNHDEPDTDMLDS